MAKHNPVNPQRSKVRLFYVDADLAPGDLQELTNALTSAIRPTHVVSRTGAAPRIAAPAVEGNGDAAEMEEVELAEVETAGGDEATELSPKSSKPRKYRSPKTVTTLDMNGGGTSFLDFVKDKKPKEEHLWRFLVSAAWCAEFASLPAVTADHVYTCYRTAGWDFDLKDPTSPFRKLSAKEYGWGATSKGAFTINHVGKSEVQKMGRKSGEPNGS